MSDLHWKTGRQAASNKGVRARLNRGGKQSIPRYPLVNNLKHWEGIEHAKRQADQADDCCQVCLVAPRAGFALVQCGHARFCESCAMRVSDMAAGCPVCRADIAMIMGIFTRHSSTGRYC